MGDSKKIITQRYGEIQGILGFGAFGVVLLSHKVQPSQPAIDHFYALKVLRRRPLQTEADYHTHVRSEFSIVSLLDHRNIARVFELLPLEMAFFVSVWSITMAETFNHWYIIPVN